MSEPPGEVGDRRGSQPDDDRMAEWVAQVGNRIAAGESVDVDRLATEFPEGVEELLMLVPAMEMVARLRPKPTRERGGASAELSSAAMLEPMTALGDFRTIRVLGRGGMGVVYEAVQISLNRRVALKILPMTSADDPRKLKRFQIEAQAAALLNDPHIVPVHMVGSENGVHFYAMQLIEGRTLAEIITEIRDERRRTARGAAPPTSAQPSARFMAELGRQAALALHHAHEQGIVHRDVKPSNLLVETSGWLWVADFGLARIAGEGDQTSTGVMMGTPRYMSPEQVIGSRGVVDHRTDVYSLGATLYELITLRPAFESSDCLELIVKIAEDEPRQPRLIDPAIPQDLETIVLKAMAKDPAGRYATAKELADDLGRFLEGRPILARPTTFLPRAIKWVRRRPMHAASALLAALFVLGLIGGIIYRDVLIQRHDQRLEGAVIRADASARLAQRHLQAFQIRQAQEALGARHVERAQDILLAIQPDRDSTGDRPLSDDRGFAWNYLMRVASRDLTVLSDRQTERVNSIALSNDGRTLATGDDDGTIRLRDSVTGRVAVTLPGHRLPVGLVAFSGDGRRLVSTGHEPRLPYQSEVILWDLTAPRLLARLDHRSEGRANQLRFDATGDRLWAFFVKDLDRGRIDLWDVAADRPFPKLISSTHTDLTILPVSDDGTLVAREEPERQLVLHDIVKDKDVGRTSRIDHQYHIAVPSPNGRFLAVAGAARTVSLWDVPTGRPNVQYPLHRDDPRSLFFSPDSRLLAVDFWNGELEIRDLDAGAAHSLPGAASAPGGTSYAFSPDSRLITHVVSTIGAHQPWKVWQLDPWRPVATYPGFLGDMGTIVFAPDNRSLITRVGTMAVRWDSSPSPEPAQPAGHTDEAWAVAFSPDSSILASGSDDPDDPRTIKLWNVATGQLIRGWNAGNGTVSALAFDPRGQVLVSGHLAKQEGVRLWDVASGRQLATFAGHTDRVRTVAISPDGKTLASSGTDRQIRIWDMETRRCLRILNDHVKVVYQVAFSPDGLLLASASGDFAVNLWDTSTGALVRKLRAVDKVQAVAFAPDGRAVATADEKGMVSIWDVNTGARVHSMAFENDYLLCLAYSPDGRTVAAAGKTRTIRLWDALTGQEVLSLEGHLAQVNGVAFSPDGRVLASCSHDGVVKLWRSSPRRR